MAGCGQCPDACTCNITDENGVPYDGSGSAIDPIVIPRAQNTPWLGTSDNGDLIITPEDVVDANDDGHAPDFAVNWCNGINPAEIETGDVAGFDPDDTEDCRIRRFRDPVEGEVMTRDPVSGRAGWVGGAVIVGGEVPLGVPLEFWGDEGNVPGGYVLCAGQLELIATYPLLFGVIGHNGNGGIDPGGGQFRIPDKRGYVVAGRDNMGGISANRLTDPNADVIGVGIGLETASLAIANLPSHGHTITVNGAATGVSVNAALTGVTNIAAGTGISIVGAATGVSIIAGGSHTHDGAGANHDFLVENSAPSSYEYLDITATNVDTAGTMRFTSNGVEGGASKKPNREANTAAAGTHAHGVSDPGHAHGVSDPTHNHGHSDPTHAHAVTDPGHAHTATAGLTGSGTPHANVQPTVAANFIMRAA